MTCTKEKRITFLRRLREICPHMGPLCTFLDLRSISERAFSDPTARSHSSVARARARLFFPGPRAASSNAPIRLLVQAGPERRDNRSLQSPMTCGSLRSEAEHRFATSSASTCAPSRCPTRAIGFTPPRVPFARPTGLCFGRAVGQDVAARGLATSPHVRAPHAAYHVGDCACVASVRAFFMRERDNGKPEMLDKPLDRTVEAIGLSRGTIIRIANEEYANGRPESGKRELRNTERRIPTVELGRVRDAVYKQYAEKSVPTL